MMMMKENKHPLVFHLLWMTLTLMISIGITEKLFIGPSFLGLTSSQQIFLLILSAGFFLSGILYFFNRLYFPKYFQFLRIPVITAVSFGLSSFLLLFLQIDFFSRTVFAAVILLNMLALFFSGRLKLGLQLLIIAPLLLVAIMLQNFDKEPRQKLLQLFASKPTPKSSQSIVNTAYLSLKVRYYDNYLQDCRGDITNCWPKTGGGLEELEGGYLVATGQGYLHYMKNNKNGIMTARRLKSVIPINTYAFSQSGESEYGQGVFRITDIATKLDGQELTLLASHHFWHKDKDCVVLRVSSLKSELTDFLGNNGAGNWRTLFESKPCMPRSSGKRSPKFHGEESGGKMIWKTDDSILMSTGDHHFDGWNSEVIAAQDPNSDYGKTLIINIDNGLSTVFTSGHRNPQGLAQSIDGSIWLTEHGPQGGDELNLLIQGANYGWPLATYGTEYGQKHWPLNDELYARNSYSEPIYSWVPSIAVSNLISLKGERFNRWRGDLLIASYTKSLHRARVYGGRVITMEPIRLRGRNGRIRDLIEDSTGRVVALLDTGSIAIIEPIEKQPDIKSGETNPIIRGEMLFSSCMGCHASSDGTKHGIGPDLARVFNKPIASAKGYNYSAALKGMTGRWSEENLDRFLASPNDFAIGNKMQIKGISEKQDRADLIDYIKTM